MSSTNSIDPRIQKAVMDRILKIDQMEKEISTSGSGRNRMNTLLSSQEPVLSRFTDNTDRGNEIRDRFLTLSRRKSESKALSDLKELDKIAYERPMFYSENSKIASTYEDINPKFEKYGNDILVHGRGKNTPYYGYNHIDNAIGRQAGPNDLQLDFFESGARDDLDAIDETLMEAGKKEKTLNRLEKRLDKTVDRAKKTRAFYADASTNVFGDVVRNQNTPSAAERSLLEYIIKNPEGKIPNTSTARQALRNLKNRMPEVRRAMMAGMKTGGKLLGVAGKVALPLSIAMAPNKAEAAIEAGVDIGSLGLLATDNDMGGDLPPQELAKRKAYNAKMRLQQAQKLKQLRSRK